MATAPSLRVRSVDSQGPREPAGGVAALALAARVEAARDWLLDRVLAYASAHGFTQHTSPRRADWIAAIEGLSASMVAALRAAPDALELRVGAEGTADPVCAFGVEAARAHRARGVPLEMYFGLMKYFRRAYLDLCTAGGERAEEAALVDRYFDRVELGFVTEWLYRDTEGQLGELQARNRSLAVDNARLHTLYESLASPVLVTDRHGGVRRLNAAARAVLDLPGEVDHLDWLDAVLASLAAECAHTHFELERDCTPSARQYEGTLARMPDLSDETAGWVVILADVTERERARRALQHAHDRLEERVDARTAELVEANTRLRAEVADRLRAEAEREQIRGQLLHAQKMEAIGTLAGGVAHDINNLVQIILGSADLLRVAGHLAERDQAHLDHISHAAERAGSLVRQLLVFSRKAPLQPRPVDLNGLVSDLLRMLQRLLGPDIEVRLELRPLPAAARVDPGGVEQLLMNLVVNARDAMPEGGVLCISTRAVDLNEDQAAPRGLPAGAYTELAVADTGVGIPPEVVARIFDPFFTTKAEGLGTGLGLAVAYGVVQQHGGDIAVESRPGQGTTFRVLLPLAGALAGEAPVRGGEALPLGTGQRVLLVEDRDGVRAVTTMLLSRHGYEVTAAPDARRALATFAADPAAFDLLLSDVILPGRTGDEFARDVLALRADLPVLFMSGHADLAGPRQLEHPLLAKPFTTAQLLQAVAARLAVAARPGADAA